MRFEVLYVENVVALSGFFARRCDDPQSVADLTSQTFVEAIASAHTFAGRGTPRAWLFAIARAVYAQHCAGVTERRNLTRRLGGHLELAEDEIDDLTERIDSQRRARELLARAAQLPRLEREAIELVDLTGLTPREAAQALDVAPGALRVRLFRARTRLRKGTT
jgi:RNA polymerase sigma factor (sigma-70 family)